MNSASRRPALICRRNAAPDIEPSGNATLAAVSRRSGVSRSYSTSFTHPARLTFRVSFPPWERAVHSPGGRRGHTPRSSLLVGDEAAALRRIGLKRPILPAVAPARASGRCRMTHARMTYIASNHCRTIAHSRSKNFTRSMMRTSGALLRWS